MYKSPVVLVVSEFFSDVVKKEDEYIVKCVHNVGVDVDKDELFEALQYDRRQYEKGWNDRDSEIVKCKDCMWGTDYYHDGDCYCLNPKWGMKYFGGSWNFYCAEAERREKDEL